MDVGPGVSLLGNGSLHLIQSNGLLGEIIPPCDLYKNVVELRDAYKKSRRSICLVHGYKYDPGVNDHDNPHLSIFYNWTGNLGTSTFGFGWYSVPGRIDLGYALVRYVKSILEAWLHGHRNTYKYAWRLASRSGPVLGMVLDALSSEMHVSGAAGIEWTIVAHSLGTKVVLGALNDYPNIPVKRVLFLNGAATCNQALVVARKCRNTEFINVVVKSDDVLRVFGKNFTGDGLGKRVVGWDGLGVLATPNWTEFVLDSPEVQHWAEQNDWNIRGDNPLQTADHWYTINYQPNWRFWKYILDGGDLAGIPTTSGH